jgi:hypothetical protein
MGLFDNAELKEAKRNYKEEMKQLASKMKANGNIPGIAKWDDSLQVISIGPIGFSTIVKYNTIKGIEIIEDIKQISSTKVKGKEKRKGTFTRAAVGTLLMPGIGTLAGALTAKKESSGEKETTTSQQITKTIRLTRDDPFKSVLTFPYNSELEYKLQDILDRNSTSSIQKKENTELETSSPTNSSIADELRKLKGLLDDGVLTEEEFKIQKERLLQ